MEGARTINVLLKWLWHQASDVRGQILLCCISGITRVALGLVFVWISKDLVDAAVGGTPASALIRMSIALVVISLAELGLQLTVQYMSTRADAAFKNSLRIRLFRHLMASKWIDRQDMHSGDLLNRLTEDARQISDMACYRLPQTVVMCSQFAGAFGLLCILSWRLAVCVVFIMPFFVLLSKVYVKRTREYTATIRSIDSSIHTQLQESLQHQPVIQSMQHEAAAIHGVEDSQKTLFATTVNRTRFGVFSSGMVHGGFTACYLVAFLWSVWSLHLGVITFGVMTAFLQLVSRIQMPIVNISRHIPAFVHSLTSIDRLIDIEGLPIEDTGEMAEMEKPVGIRISSLSFRYKTAQNNVFSDFSYDFKPGSKTVLTGETGVGKSTLIKLLLALLSPDKGTITLYDSDREVAVSAATRCNMVYVPQGNSLLARTIRDNLLMADPTATEQRMREVLHIANADFVYSLPKDIDTMCGELGSGLSEGQAQRIAIARALLRPGAILLFDEFNSSLDIDTAHTLMQRLTEYCKDRTIIFISHRPEVEAFCTERLHLPHTRSKR